MRTSLFKIKKNYSIELVNNELIDMFLSLNPIQEIL